MFKYVINVALKSAEGRYEHYFRVELEAGDHLFRALSIASDMRTFYGDKANVTLTRWTTPVGTDVPVPPTTEFPGKVIRG